jgi:hypothetical protein
MRMPKCLGMPERAGVEVIDKHPFRGQKADDLNAGNTQAHQATPRLPANVFHRDTMQ